MPIAPSRRFVAGMLLFITNLMVVLDTTIANVSVPHIAGSLGATMDQGAWVITSYAAAEAICVPLCGWLAQRFGEVRLFLAMQLGFTIFSLLCGLSVSLPMLVACRIGQGLCGGPLMPLVQTLAQRIFAPAQLPKAMALWSLTVMLGPALGPVVGGLIADAVSWHWIFFVNVPVGLACAAAGSALLAPVKSEVRRVPIDAVGMILLAIWIGALQVMLDTGRDKDWFASPTILVLAIMAAVGFCAFVIWELTEEHPAVNLRLLAEGPFGLVLLAMSLCYGALFSGTVVLPQWLQATMQYSATDAGLILAMSPLASLLSTQVTLWLLFRYDARKIAALGGLMVGVSFLLRMGWSTEVSAFDIGWVVLFQGAAMPLLMMSLTNMSISVIPPAHMASGAGLAAFCRTMSLALGTASVLTVWGNQQAVSHTELADSLQPSATVATLTQAGMPDGAVTSYLNGLVNAQAVTQAMIYVCGVAICAILVATVSLAITPRIELTRFRGAKDKR